MALALRFSRRFWLGLAGAVGAVVVFLAVSGPEATGEPRIAECGDCRIVGVRFAGYRSVPILGDLWPSTPGPDGQLFFAFGDGSGMTECLPVEGLDWWPPPRIADVPRLTVTEAYGGPNEDFCGVFDCAEARRYPLCPYTRTGVVALRGRLPDLRLCDGTDQCLISRHLPTGREEDGRDVKPSSMIFAGGALVMHLHEPSARPRHGFLAVSRDRGRSWREIDGTPWGRNTPFRVITFLQDARGAGQYVYGYGIRDEIDVDDMHLQEVFLARVESGRILDHGAWRYFAGLDGQGRPRWVESPGTARPLPGLATMIQGGALYHRGIGRYLFFSGFTGFAPAREIGVTDRSGPSEAGSLFEAPTPWGPWARVGQFPGGYIGAMIAADDRGARLWFTAAGNTVSYNLHIGRLDLQLRR